MFDYINPWEFLTVVLLIMGGLSLGFLLWMETSTLRGAMRAAPAQFDLYRRDTKMFNMEMERRTHPLPPWVWRLSSERFARRVHLWAGQELARTQQDLDEVYEFSISGCRDRLLMVSEALKALQYQAMAKLIGHQECARLSTSVLHS